MHVRSVLKLAALMVAAAVVDAPAIAGTTTSNLSVSGTVSANCTVSTTTLAFGTYNTLSATNNDATATLNVTCTPGSAWTATAGVGTGTGATFASRKLVSGANLLNYTIYTDSARTTVWGDGTAPTANVAGTGTGAVQATTVYGRIPGSQSTVAAGSFADTVAVTITF